jgi:hypothetical protein
MTQYIPEILLWLFVINLGIVFGAALYEQRIVVPLWFRRSSDSHMYIDTEAMRETDAGKRFWMFVTTGPLTLLTVTNLVLAWQSLDPRHPWWLAAAVLTLLERIGTFTYFIPTALKLMGARSMPPERAAAMASRWMSLNWIRVAVNLIAWLAALKTLSLPA